MVTQSLRKEETEVMANGDKPGGGVLVKIDSPNVHESVSITCHSEAEADAAAKDVAEACRKIAKKYE